jgi:SAM-dependent methyltransferase
MENKSLSTYQKLCVEFYDLEQHPRHEQALKFYMQHALQAQGPILEPMCGTGRFLIPMLQAGLDAEGFDASPYMLDVLKQKHALINSKEAPVTQQFVQDFTSSKKYSLIFIPYGSWGLITDMSDVQKGLMRLYDYLLPGGMFMVEIETVASVPQPCGIWRSGSHTKSDGSIIALRFITSYNSTTQIFQAHSYYESKVSNRVLEHEEELFEQYLYRSDEFDVMLNGVGFSRIEKYPAFDPNQKIKENSPIIIYECVK